MMTRREIFKAATSITGLAAVAIAGGRRKEPDKEECPRCGHKGKDVGNVFTVDSAIHDSYLMKEHKDWKMFHCIMCGDRWLVFRPTLKRREV